jgi:hypothetical protein
MVKSYVEMLKSKQTNKESVSMVECLSNVGKKWTEEEENKLLEELNKNIDIETISQNHKRKIGGIESRRKEIAYKMYMRNVSIDKIILKTKLDYETIKQIINIKQYDNKKPKLKLKNPISLENEISEIKNDIKDLKKSITELSDMLKAVYDFEHT